MKFFFFVALLLCLFSSFSRLNMKYVEGTTEKETTDKNVDKN